MGKRLTDIISSCWVVMAQEGRASRPIIGRSAGRSLALAAFRGALDTEPQITPDGSSMAWPLSPVYECVCVNG